MPKVTVSPVKGEILTIPVDDKSEAVRVVSTRLRTIYSDRSVIEAMNKWLSSAMKTPLRLGTGEKLFTLNYRD